MGGLAGTEPVATRMFFASIVCAPSVPCTSILPWPLSRAAPKTFVAPFVLSSPSTPETSCRTTLSLRWRKAE